MVEMTCRRTESSWAGSVGSFAPCACRLKISSSTCEASTGRFATTASTRSTTTVVSPRSTSGCPGAIPGVDPTAESTGAAGASTAAEAESTAAESVAVESTVVESPRRLSATVVESAAAESATEVESCAASRPAAAQRSSETSEAVVRIQRCCLIVPSSGSRYFGFGAPLSAGFGAVGAAPGIGGPPGAGRKAPLGLVVSAAGFIP